MTPEQAFRILGAPCPPTPEQLKTAYRQRCRTWHPDINKSPDATAHFKIVQQAYDIAKNHTVAHNNIQHQTPGTTQQQPNINYKDAWKFFRMDYKEVIEIPEDQAPKDIIIKCAGGFAGRVDLFIPAGTKLPIKFKCGITVRYNKYCAD